jgi:hypothetical protein
MNRSNISISKIPGTGYIPPFVLKGNLMHKIDIPHVPNSGVDEGISRLFDNYVDVQTNSDGFIENIQLKPKYSMSQPLSANDITKIQYDIDDLIEKVKNESIENEGENESDNIRNFDKKIHNIDKLNAFQRKIGIINNPKIEQMEQMEQIGNPKKSWWTKIGGVKRKTLKSRIRRRTTRKRMRGGVDPSDTSKFNAPGRQSLSDQIMTGSPAESYLHFKYTGSNTSLDRPEDIINRLNDNHDDRSREIDLSRIMIQKMKQEAEAKSKRWWPFSKGGKNKSRKGTRRRKQHSKKRSAK